MYYKVRCCIKRVAVTGSLWENGTFFSVASKPDAQASVEPIADKARQLMPCVEPKTSGVMGKVFSMFSSSDEC